MKHKRKTFQVNPDYLNLRNADSSLEVETDKRLTFLQGYMAGFQKLLKREQGGHCRLSPMDVMAERIIRAAHKRGCYCDAMSGMTDEQVDELAKKVASNKE